LIERLQGVGDRLKQSIAGRVVQRYLSADAALFATVIAYNAIFAMFPIVLALLFLLGLVLRSAAVFDQVSDIIARALPGNVATELVYALQGTRQSSGLLGIVGFFGLLWAGSALFGAMAVAFNRLYGVPDRPLVYQQLMGMAMIFLFAVLLLLSFAASTVAQVLIGFADRLPIAGLPGFALLAPAISYLVSFVSALALFLAIYHVVPNVQLGLGEVWPGALLTTVLFVLLVQVFPLYVRLVANFERFGAIFGFLFLLLTWFYVVAQALLIGVTLNAVRKPDPRPRGR